MVLPDALVGAMRFVFSFEEDRGYAFHLIAGQTQRFGKLFKMRRKCGTRFDGARRLSDNPVSIMGPTAGRIGVTEVPAINLRGSFALLLELRHGDRVSP
jgi:hypothetical protein